MTPLETEANPNIRVGPLRWGRPRSLIMESGIVVMIEDIGSYTPAFGQVR